MATFSDVTYGRLIPDSIGGDGGQTLCHPGDGGLSDAQHLLGGRVQDRVGDGRDGEARGADRSCQGEQEGEGDVVVLEKVQNCYVVMNVTSL